MPLVPNAFMVPPGGFHFLDTSGPEPMRIEGDGFDDVASKVLKHRLQNGRPPGNPGAEIIDYVCGTWPHVCRDTTPPVIPAGVSAINLSQGLSTRCATWIAAFFVGNRADRGISINETQRRADICCACPFNQEFRSGCGSCVDSVNRLFFVWRRDRPLPRESELGACNILGQHNGCGALAATLPELSDGLRDRLPANCWRKTI